mgnify:CR=1 FL=1
MKLQDLMTANQALKIIEMLEELTKKVNDLEKEVENLKNERS